MTGRGLKIVLGLLLAGSAGLNAEISRRNIRYVEYLDFTEAHSTWGSIGYSSTYDRVYVGVTNHRDRVGLFEYDAATESMRLVGFIPEMAHLRPWQWQGKVHSQIVESPDGKMYFTTDGGETRMLYTMNHETGYHGGFYMRYDPASGRLDQIGTGPLYESVKDIMISRTTGQILGATFPQVKLLLYDPNKNDLRDLGRLGGAHVPRVLFGDRYGNLYYVDWRQRLVKYEPATDSLVFAAEPLPAFPETEGYSIITGITAWAENPADGTIYLVTYGSKLVEFHPRERGMGDWRDLGGIYDSPEGSKKERWSYYCPNLALAQNGRLYYFIGGHGSYVGGGERTVLMEYDTASGAKREVLDFPLSEIEEVTGANVTDRHGNLYFAGRRNDPRAAQMGESGASRPFMIIFNPQREVN